MKRVVKLIALIWLVSFFIACASAPPKRKASLSQKKDHTTPSVLIDGKSVVIGCRQLYRPHEGFYVLIESSPENKWHIKMISKKPLRRRNRNQEVLYVNSDLNYVQPYYEECERSYNNCVQKDCVFVCPVFGGIAPQFRTEVKRVKKTYNPCTSNLTKRRVARSIPFELLFAPVTGGYVTVFRTLDVPKMIKICNSIHLIREVQYYKELEELYEKLRERYTKMGQKIRLKSKIIKDYPGFGMVTENLVNRELKFSVAHDTVTLPDDFDEHYRQYTDKDIEDLFEGKTIIVHPYFSKSTFVFSTNHFKLKCHICLKKPGPIRVYYTSKMEDQLMLEVPVVIDYCDMIYPSPCYYSLEDQNLKVDFIRIDYHKLSISVTNKTATYVTLDSVALYYRNKVSYSLPPRTEIAPYSTNQVDLIIDLSPRDAYLSHVVKSKIETMDIRFGLAVKYTISGSSKTLVKISRIKPCLIR